MIAVVRYEIFMILPCNTLMIQMTERAAEIDKQDGEKNQNEEKSSIDDESEEEGSDHKQVAKSTSIAQETQGVKQ